MSIQPLSPDPARGASPDLLGRASNPEEAAKAFEHVLVQQFVKTLTDPLFKTSLSGDEGPGWMKAYGDTQRSMLTDVLTGHLVDEKTFGLADLLLSQWQRQAGAEDPSDIAASDADGAASIKPLTP
ncbi:MAG: peptidoglycan hydrolase [Rhodothermales bacterium]|nr:peptidoglycan hydrolase [Rhodothermales bacterium]